ncbi:putative 3,9-dihydroxypterocarpan 6A-monooxygenase [Heracleum sosnowskyi]|uniref:3,9-dihydroxypterocarpan 6A-monooxygenase n=1 Tax=Heracleum sosnowskyi TaxID=360622 RepID=A0AAD8HEX3_9APIA|nr:putative 3,9-dihydroxypterocarpan 6A-monooxygenase [Heracleum sosnowskyi]
MADYQGYIVIFLCFVIPVVVLQAIFKSRATSSLPPGPPKLPIIGHLHLLGPIPHQAFHKLSIRYGPLIHVFAGSNHCVIASSPEMAKEFRKTHIEMSLLLLQMDHIGNL